MLKPVSDVALTQAVKAEQERRGSRAGYAKMEQQAGWPDRGTPRPPPVAPLPHTPAAVLSSHPPGPPPRPTLPDWAVHAKASSLSPPSLPPPTTTQPSAETSEARLQAPNGMTPRLTAPCPSVQR